MSRTRRRLIPSYRPGSLKWYPLIFRFEERQLLGYWRQGMVPTRFLPQWEREPHDPAWRGKPRPEQDWIDMAFEVHHAVFRNGTCRRQRQQGVRITKELARRGARRAANQKLRRQVIENDFDGLPASIPAFDILADHDRDCQPQWPETDGEEVHSPVGDGMDAARIILPVEPD